MKITDEKIEQLANLSKLEFTKEGKEKIKVDLMNILDLCEKLNTVNTDGVSPLIYMTETVNNVRPDQVVESVSRAEGLKNAPKKDSDYFRVPKVIEKA